MVTAEKSSVIEFQHPFFKQGKAHLLENIKRKVQSKHVFTSGFFVMRGFVIKSMSGGFKDFTANKFHVSQGCVSASLCNSLPNVRLTLALASSGQNTPRCCSAVRWGRTAVRLEPFSHGESMCTATA